jgi:hypothetical protein
MRRARRPSAGRTARNPRAIQIHRRVVLEVALDRAGVRIDEQLGRVVQDALLGHRGAVDPEPVALAWADAGEVAVEDLVRRLGQRHQRLRAVVVEQRHRYR